MSSPRVKFFSSSASEAPGRELLEAMGLEVLRLLGVDFNAEGWPKAGPSELAPPGGAFLLGIHDGQAVCCGGIKRLDHEACEIKRMYVRPDARRNGIAELLLNALELKALALGYQVARLDTNSRLPGAQRLFEAAGYETIDNFNGDPTADYFGEKRLRKTGGDAAPAEVSADRQCRS